MIRRKQHNERKHFTHEFVVELCVYVLVSLLTHHIAPKALVLAMMVAPR